jgi:16S rRNA (guanine1516-N2)-methyltransferase
VIPARPQLLLFSESCASPAQDWAAQLGLTALALGERRHTLENLLGQHEAVLVFDEQGLALQTIEKPLPGPVRVDFAGGTLRWRLAHGGGRGEMVAKACAVKKGFVPRVLDCTAGLGRDALILASLGCELTLCERSPLVAALLVDGLRRAALDAELAPLIARMHFQPGEALAALLALAAAAPEQRPDVVLLDPMFPHREKSALVKKEMRVFRAIVGEDLDADALLAPALAVARKRVVVKRPKQAPFLAGKKPSLELAGQSSRFDIYLV